ncbi:MAG: TetR/AcrR family transcriptional regulator [Alphaproteobacteria bacterium]|mgnify:CR=1 FL=1|jgi:Transcriptional regulator|nr:TetR/AcrR family transcriptional regulator [Alphaproteobacteria bacterium]MBU0794228.1 TetR/AcrR family transcriptional regulator [Alphaproteobacteria bacterium]MBU0876579.1 TetR/AcrR family transcriptional regulator [Alphaproteobacteria bacterium]MBU1769280.1 TetR/AcrR family transcriptional regulator [Alphaproteobacteria bacterium]
MGDVKKPRKRGQGRPAENVVGREAVLETARRLVKEHPPARISIAMIAREAGVDPALVRYYFKDRSNLLLAVATSMMDDLPYAARDPRPADKVIENNIRRSALFTRSNRHIHRLMVDELADAKASDVSERLGEMNREAVAWLGEVLARDASSVRKVDPALLHVAILGLFDFFATAEPVVRQLFPDDTDPDELAARYEEFVVDLLMNGLRSRT